MTEATALAVIDDGEVIEASGRSSALVLPVADPQALVHAMRQYQATKNAILDRSDFQNAGKTDFVKKSGWAKLAIAFGVSSRITDRRYERNADGELIRAELIVRAEAPNGRFAEGLGVCHVGEERFTHGKDHPKGWWKAGDPNNRDKIEHDLPATAETRARNRAYSALFGHGEVSWEEVDAGNFTAEVIESQPANPERERLLDRVTESLRQLTAKRQTTGKKLMLEWTQETGGKNTPMDMLNNPQLKNLLEWSDKQLQPTPPTGQRYTAEQVDAMPEDAKQRAEQARAEIDASVAATVPADDVLTF